MKVLLYGKSQKSKSNWRSHYQSNWIHTGFSRLPRVSIYYYLQLNQALCFPFPFPSKFDWISPQISMVQFLKFVLALTFICLLLLTSAVVARSSGGRGGSRGGRGGKTGGGTGGRSTAAGGSNFVRPGRHVSHSSSPSTFLEWPYLIAIGSIIFIYSLCFISVT